MTQIYRCQSKTSPKCRGQLNQEESRTAKSESISNTSFALYSVTKTMVINL